MQHGCNTLSTKTRTHRESMDALSLASATEFESSHRCRNSGRARRIAAQKRAPRTFAPITDRVAVVEDRLKLVIGRAYALKGAPPSTKPQGRLAALDIRPHRV